jgi:pyruvate dehydrogenase E1 component alpha subunit
MRAATLAREKKLPTLLEVRTYRFMGHSMSDPIHGHYRTREEVEEQRGKDPIPGLFKRLEAAQLFSQADYDALDQEVIAECDDAVAFADESPEPEPESLYSDVYRD